MSGRGLLRSTFDFAGQRRTGASRQVTQAQESLWTTAEHELVFSLAVHIQLSKSDSSAQHITNRYQFAVPDQHYGVSVIHPVERVFQTHQRETVQELRTLLERTRDRDEKTHERSAMTPNAAPAHDEHTIQRLTDRVIQSIDRRVIAQRERLGAG